MVKKINSQLNVAVYNQLNLAVHIKAITSRMPSSG